MKTKYQTSLLASVFHVKRRMMDVWSSYVCPLLGTLCDFMGNKLLFYENISKSFLLDKEKLINGSRVQCIYGNASYASAGQGRRFKLILDYQTNYIKIIRKNKSLNSSQKYQDKTKNSRNTQKSFFSACNCNSFENCSCSKIKKDPITEQFFWLSKETLKKW